MYYNGHNIDPHNPYNNGHNGHNNGVTLVKLGLAIFLANKVLTDPSSVNRGAFNLLKALFWLSVWVGILLFFNFAFDPRHGFFPR